MTVANQRTIFETIKKSAVVIGGLAFLFIALRNSVTWYFQRFWGASGDLWQSLFVKFLDTVGRKELNVDLFIYFYGISFYWALSGLFMILDVYNKPAFLMKYKMQPDKNAPLNPLSLIKVAQNILLNHFVTLLYCIPFVKLYKLRGVEYFGELPTFHWVVFEFIIFIIVEEIGFYYSHRFLHKPPYYSMIHKQHHEWQAPVALAAIYAHPVEHIMSNLTPMLMGPLIMGSHVASIFLWVNMVVFSTINAHCGFHFPFFPSPEAHDYHHLKFSNCFGMLGVLDRLHNTDDTFRKTPMYKRHIMMMTLTPPREVFPDQIKAASE